MAVTILSTKLDAGSEIHDMVIGNEGTVNVFYGYSFLLQLPERTSFPAKILLKNFPNTLKRGPPGETPPQRI